MTALTPTGRSWQHPSLTTKTHMLQRRNTVPHSLRRRRTAAAGVTLALVGLAACSTDQVTAPATPVPSAAPVANITPLTPLTGDAAKRLGDVALTALASTWRTSAGDVEAPTTKPIDLTCGLQGTYMIRKRVGRAGGTLLFGRNELRIPSGALAADTDISATVTLGRGVKVDFAPHGLKFARAVELRVDWTGCTLPSGQSANLYYTDSYNRITQVMPSSTSGTRSRMLTDHFSGYTVSWGRSRY